MSVEIVVAVFGALWLILCGVVAWAVKDVLDGIRARLTQVENRLAELDRTVTQMDANRNEIEKLWDQIGRDSESGMRKMVHRTATVCQRADMKVDELGRRVQNIERRNPRKL